MMRIATGEVEGSAGESAGHDEGCGLDAVRNNAVAGAVQFRDTFNSDGRSARAFDVRAHFVQQVGEVGDLGLAGAVQHHGFTVGESRRHQQVFGASYGDLVENNFATMQPFGGGFHVTMVLGNGCAQKFEPLDVKINRAISNGAASGKGDAGAAATGD